jgi:drug/metabolite transporter (DMT)-like permease
VEKNQKQAYWLAIIAVLLWSTVATAFKITLNYLTPVQMVLLASVVSAVALFAVVAWQGNLKRLPEYLRQRPLFYLCLGLINPFIYYLVLFKAYQLLPASQAQPLNYSWAITLTVMSAIFLGQKIRGKDWIACGLGYSGVVVIATQGDLLQLQFDNPLGVGLALLSTLLWATYWILNTRNAGDPVAGLSLAFLLSLPFSAATCWWLDGWPSLNIASALGVIYIGLFEMGITFVFWLLAMKKAQHTARISNLIFVSPFISLILLATIIGESIHPSTLVGLGLIVTGLVWQNRGGSRDVSAQ